jgi:hypothetical protein
MRSFKGIGRSFRPLEYCKLSKRNNVAFSERGPKFTSLLGKFLMPNFNIRGQGANTPSYQRVKHDESGLVASHPLWQNALMIGGVRT